MLGKEIPGYDFPACDIFQPVVFDGRLCYSLGKEIAGRTKEGKENGLLLMINPKTMKNTKSIHNDMESSSFKIYLHTLSGFSGHKSGSFALNSLKLMTGTSGFMDLPDDQKRCEVHLREDCKTREFVKDIEQKCGCIPWAIKNAATMKVNFELSYFFHCLSLSLQAGYCNPVEQMCVQRVQKQKVDGCRTSCTGLHADVTLTDDSFTRFIRDQFEKQQSDVAKGKSGMRHDQSPFPIFLEVSFFSGGMAEL